MIQFFYCQVLVWFFCVTLWPLYLGSGRKKGKNERRRSFLNCPTFLMESWKRNGSHIVNILPKNLVKVTAIELERKLVRISPLCVRISPLMVFTEPFFWSHLWPSLLAFYTTWASFMPRRGILWGDLVTFCRKYTSIFSYFQGQLELWQEKSVQSSVVDSN